MFILVVLNPYPYIELFVSDRVSRLQLPLNSFILLRDVGRLVSKSWRRRVKERKPNVDNTPTP